MSGLSYTKTAALRSAESIAPKTQQQKPNAAAIWPPVATLPPFRRPLQSLRPFATRCNAAALSPPVATLPPFGFDSCEAIGLMIDSAKVRCSADAIYSAMQCRCYI
jgi:hypothetical protein